jgi:pimeloyl-ACP methyl ester carboxylesterase
MRETTTAPFYLYLHGFASSAASKKGVRLRDVFAARGAELHLPDLNRPSFATLDHDAMLAEVDRVAGQAPAGAPVRLIGSSLGGWLAARWAELNPARTDRVVLLCPGFDMVSRWPAFLGPERIEKWRSRGYLPFPDASGAPVPVHWGFVESALRHPPTPTTPCPTLILHGREDVVVPIEGSRAYTEAHAHVTLRELDDDHALTATLPAIESEVLRFFDLHEG